MSVSSPRPEVAPPSHFSTDPPQLAARSRPLATLAHTLCTPRALAFTQLTHVVSQHLTSGAARLDLCPTSPVADRRCSHSRSTSKYTCEWYTDTPHHIHTHTMDGREDRMGTTSVRCVVNDIQPIDTQSYHLPQHSPFTRTVVPRNRSGPHTHVQDTATDTYTTSTPYSLRTSSSDTHNDPHSDVDRGDARIHLPSSPHVHARSQR